MVKVKWSTDGLWYTLSHKNEKVFHFLRFSKTEYEGMKIYEIQIWKLSIALGTFKL